MPLNCLLLVTIFDDEDLTLVSEVMNSKFFTFFDRVDKKHIGEVASRG